MRVEPQVISLRTVFKTALVFWLACTVLFSFILAADHEFHREVCHDADHADHQCLVVLLAQGTIDVPSFTSFVVALVLLVVGWTSPALAISLSSPHYRLLPGRAPPVRFA